MNRDPGQAQPGKLEPYEIKLKGHLDELWSEWFDDLTITYDEYDNTILGGQVTDQSALHGLLKKAHDLGLRLISVTEVEANSSNQ
jgi:hypothetical protein